MFKAKYIYKNYAFSIFDHTTMRKKLIKMNWMDGSTMDGLWLRAKYSSFVISSMAPKTSTFFDLKTCLRSKTPHSRSPLLRDNEVALQGHRVNSKKLSPGRVLDPKRNQNGSKTGHFKKNSSAQWPKKSLKIGSDRALD